MKKLTIEIQSNKSNFGHSLDEIKSQIDKGFLEGFDGGEEDNYTFNIT